MKKYDSYKDSGIEWLGVIPEHWDVKKLKFISKICNGQDQKAVLEDNGIYPVYGSGGIFGRANSYLFDQPSVLLGRKGTIDKPQYVEEPFWTVDTSYYTKIREGFSVRLFYYLCTTINFDLYKYGSAIPSMTQGHLNEIKFALPDSLEEQNAIANYLDHKTTQIDTLISKKQQFITLLQEERIAVINQAVTKGLDPKVKMKDSGIEWIGVIPEHWEVKRLKYAAKIFRGKFTHRPRNDERLYNGQFPFFQTGDIARSGKFLSNYTQTLNELGLASSTLFLKGTIVMTIAANIGDIAILGLDACFPDSIVGFEPFEDIIHRDYFYFTLKSKRDEFINASIKNTQLNLNIERISTIYLTIPPFEEQEKIVDYIENKIREIETIITKTQQEIELLKEYKTALISEVVTGKVDVREETRKVTK